MPGLTKAEKAQRNWERIAEKLTYSATRSLSVFLVPEEVKVLVASMEEISMQAMLLQKVIEKYPDLWDNLVETLNVNDSEFEEHVRGVQSSDGDSPEVLLDASEAERSDPVAG
jgi:hypothetical protein